MSLSSSICLIYSIPTSPLLDLEGARGCETGMSYSAPKVVQLQEYVNAVSSTSTLVFVVGAMAHGKIDVDYIDDLVAGILSNS